MAIYHHLHGYTQSLWLKSALLDHRLVLFMYWRLKFLFEFNLNDDSNLISNEFWPKVDLIALAYNQGDGYKTVFLRDARRFWNKRSESEEWWNGNCQGVTPNEDDNEEDSSVSSDFSVLSMLDTHPSMNRQGCQSTNWRNTFKKQKMSITFYQRKTNIRADTISLPWYVFGPLVKM